MSQYLYVIIPCKRKRFSNKFISSLKTLSPSIIDDDDILTLGNGFLSINTCAMMYSLTIFNDEGTNYIRNEMIEVAKSLHANELWYVDKLTHDEFNIDDFSLDEWTKKTHNELRYCTMEYDKNKIKNGRIASIIHDSIEF